MDINPILPWNALLEYLTKYVTKNGDGVTWRPRMATASRNTLHAVTNDLAWRRRYREDYLRPLVATAGDREMAAQERSHNMVLPGFLSSRRFQATSLSADMGRIAAEIAWRKPW